MYMAKFNQKTVLQPLAAFSMAIILGIYVKHAINESRRESIRRQRDRIVIMKEEINDYTLIEIPSEFIVK